MASVTDGDQKTSYLSAYLNTVPPSSIKGSVFSFLIVPLFLFSFGSLFIPPFVGYIAFLLIGGNIVFILWGLYIAMNPYRMQRAYFLYIGSVTGFTSLGLLIVSVKFIYYTMAIHEYWYIVFIIAAYSALIYWLWRLHKKALYSGVYAVGSIKKKGRSLKQFGYLGLAMGIGMIGSQLLLSLNSSYDASLAALGCLFNLLGLIMLLVSHNIHKYILMRKHPELVHYYEKPIVAKKGERSN